MASVTHAGDPGVMAKSQKKKPKATNSAASQPKTVLVVSGSILIVLVFIGTRCKYKQNYRIIQTKSLQI